MRSRGPFKPLAHDQLRDSAGYPPAIRTALTVRGRCIEIGDALIKRMFDGCYPKLVGVLVQGCAAEADTADFLTSTSERALFQFT